MVEVIADDVPFFARRARSNRLLDGDYREGENGGRKSIKTVNRRRRVVGERWRGCRESTELAFTRPPEQTVKPALDGRASVNDSSGRLRRRATQEEAKQKGKE